MNKKCQSHLWLLFILVVFSILFVTNLFLAIVIIILVHLNVFSIDKTLGILPIAFTLLSSVVLGTGISSIISKRILKPLTTLSNATKAVAKGDFNIQINTNHRIKELKETALNFNTMVKELASIETLRDDFVINVSHEFKSPIAAIEGYATLLRNKDLTDEEKNEYTLMILESARQLSTLTGNILKISNLESKETILEKKPFRLDEQIRQALLLLEPTWSKKNIDLDIILDTIRFNGNEGLLMQVWLNLLDNAIKFTPDHGIIKITLEKHTHEVIVMISDNGIGMTADTQNHIFEKFYQADKTRYTQGSGLGLTLCKRIIDLSHGSIEVESECNHGTTFTINLRL